MVINAEIHEVMIILCITLNAICSRAYNFALHSMQFLINKLLNTLQEWDRWLRLFSY